jgi:hypothetical protein
MDDGTRALATIRLPKVGQLEPLVPRAEQPTKFALVVVHGQGPWPDNSAGTANSRR